LIRSGGSLFQGGQFNQTERDSSIEHTRNRLPEGHGRMLFAGWNAINHWQ